MFGFENCNEATSTRSNRHAAIAPASCSSSVPAPPALICSLGVLVSSFNLHPLRAHGSDACHLEALLERAPPCRTPATPPNATNSEIITAAMMLGSSMIPSVPHVTCGYARYATRTEQNVACCYILRLDMFWRKVLWDVEGSKEQRRCERSAAADQLSVWVTLLTPRTVCSSG